MVLRVRLKILILIAIGLMAVLVRLLPLLRSDLSFAFFARDWVQYLQLAHGIRHGCGFARLIDGSCQAAEILRTPGYPLFIAAMPSVRWVLVGQAFLGGAACLLVGTLLARNWNFRAAIIGELFVALDIPSIVMTSIVMSETMFQVVLALALLAPLMLLWRRNENISSQTALSVAAAISGLLAGCALLIRPIAIILPILLPIPFVFAPGFTRRARVRAGAIAFAVPSLIAVGWSFRNYELAGYPGLSTVGAVNVYYYRAADVIARNDAIPFTTARDLLGPELGVPYQRIFDASVQSPELTRRMKRLGFRILEAHPLDTAIMTLQSAVFLALAPIHGELVALLGMPEDSAGGLNPGKLSLGRVRTKLRALLQSPVLTTLTLYQLALVAVLWIGVAAALMRCINEKAELRLGVLYLTNAALVLLMLAAGPEAEARFRAPVLPLLAVVSALGYSPACRFQESTIGEPVGRLANSN